MDTRHGALIRRYERVSEGVCVATAALAFGGLCYGTVRLILRTTAIANSGGRHPLEPHPTSIVCGPGLVLPLDEEQEMSWPNRVRAGLYLVGLLYCFAGVAIVADTFMQAIEQITSAERTGPDGRPRRVWNATVANLTLMALGSSAPEILLSVIELLGNEFYSGELGPSTIVGSAAFNLFVITAVCVAAIPSTEARSFDAIGVLYTTAFASVAAYVWLLVILAVSSPNAVEIWEAGVTFAAFPVLVLAAYRADRAAAANADFKRLEEEQEERGGVGAAGMARRRRLQHAARVTLAKLALSDAAERAHVRRTLADIGRTAGSAATRDPTDEDLESVARTLRNFGLDPAHYNHRPEHLARLIASRSLDALGKSRAARRIEAVRSLTGGRRPPRMPPAAAEFAVGRGRKESPVHFSAAIYAVYESEREVVVTVVREPSAAHAAETVVVRSVDGTATAGEDYEKVDEVVHFGANERFRELRVRIMEDNVKEGNETFELALYRSAGSSMGAAVDALRSPRARANCRGGDGGGRAGAGTEPSSGPVYRVHMPPPVGSAGSAAVAPAPGARGAIRAAHHDKLHVAVGAAVRGSRRHGHAQMEPVSRVRVVITDVAGSGHFRFAKEEYSFPESKSFEMSVVRENGCMGAVTVRYRTVGGVPGTLARQVTGELVFAHGELCKSIELTPVNSLSVTGRASAFAVVLERDDAPADPPVQAQVVIQDDPELRELCAEVLRLVPAKLEELRAQVHLGEITATADVGPGGSASTPGGDAGAKHEAGLCESWCAQIEEALRVHGGEEEVEDDDALAEGGGVEDEEAEALGGGGGGAGAGGNTAYTWGDLIGHVITLPWKLAFAVLIPPASVCGGWLCFFCALGVIGAVTAIIGDLASILGCCVGLADEVTAITLVALGTSLPDTFASRAAALADESADNAVGNVTGSNAVNVLLGLGMPWVLGAAYWARQGPTDEWRARVGADIAAAYPQGAFIVEAGTLGYSVAVFSTGALFCLSTVILRAWRGYALGGPYNNLVALFFVLLWVVYVTLSILNSS